MELTDEIKTKIIAMYGESHCITPDGQGVIKDLSFLDSDVNVFLPGESGELKLFLINDIKLILKPIEKLTLEVAKEIGSLFKKNYHKEFSVTEVKITTSETIVIGYFITYIDVHIDSVLLNNSPEKNIYKIAINNWGGINIYGSRPNKSELLHNDYAYFIYQILIENGYDMPNIYLDQKTLKKAGLAVYQEEFIELSTDANESLKK
ncbi:hypothetical protein [Emticicia sp. BO119]|uniref:hypothetical protein n=1 Tax=Emticicia sp. BO119 TaxID=2757768 RepID=UPI0015F0259C|nr:hypothetical protein [Emticicia sp. BO119]MBA4848996.1 hypothetical protein [Emticicia sp. BO119]